MAYDKSIQQLFTLARNGDETAKNELFSILRVRIFNLAKYKMASLEVGDLVQEVLVTFFKKFHQIESETKVLPFLFAILSHKLGNWYQKAQGLREGVPIELITAQYAKVAGGGDPEEIFGAAELEGILRQALMIVQRRSPEGAKVFQCLLQGYSMAEIKKELGIKNLNTVYVKINRARKMLRAILKKEFNLEV